MRVVKVASAVWTVLASADESGRTLIDDLEDGSADSRNTRMLALLESFVPNHGPPTHNKSQCRKLQGYDDLFEFKVPGLRVFWFYDVGDPKIRRCVVCTQMIKKSKKKATEQALRAAAEIRARYLQAKRRGTLEIQDES